jgi:hypothetical protein
MRGERLPKERLRSGNAPIRSEHEVEYARQAQSISEQERQAVERLLMDLEPLIQLD